jgi:parallel beta-helix repeat protein
VAVALEKVGGGHTIVLKRGEYRGPITVTAKAAGTEKHPTIIKSEKKWEAKIVGSTGESPALSSDEDCPWVVFDGFEVYGAAAGVWLGGEHNTARNCWVHNNWAMGISSHSRTGNVIENNLIEYNGQHPHLHHGIYADGEDLLVCNNIIRHNAAFGLHLYSSMKKAVVVNNLIYGHHHQSGIILYSPAGGGGGENLIVNNTVVDNARGISIAHGNGEKLYNNIVIAREPGFVFDTNEDTVNTLADYNLCVPSSLLQGPHGLSVDPGFLQPNLMCYWLRKDSPARGKGTTEYAPKTDFWGRELPAVTPPDLGALVYSNYWASEEAMNTLPNRFPNRFAQGRTEWELPDLWFAPKDDR